MAQHIVKCLYCGIKFDTNKEEFVKPTTNRYAHKVCYDNRDAEQVDREEFNNLVKELLGTTCNFAKIKAQTTKYLKEGKTYKNMTRALKYFYKIKGNSASQANGGIGIIPHIYDEAIRYFEDKEKIKNKVIEKDITEVHVKSVKIKRQPILKPVNKEFFVLD